MYISDISLGSQVQWLCGLVVCRNYSADATAFVVTYPIDSNPDNLEAALAWEAAFIQLAKTQLTNMAAAAKLKIAFQAER